MKVIPEMRCVHSIRYLRFYYHIFDETYRVLKDKVEMQDVLIIISH